jgi:hypothetical protein
MPMDRFPHCGDPQLVKFDFWSSYVKTMAVSQKILEYTYWVLERDLLGRNLVYDACPEKYMGGDFRWESHYLVFVGFESPLHVQNVWDVDQKRRRTRALLTCYLHLKIHPKNLQMSMVRRTMRIASSTTPQPTGLGR